MMQITYAFSGFREVAGTGRARGARRGPGALQAPPAYVVLEVEQ